MAHSKPETVTLHWHRFNKLTDARRQFRATPCVYMQTDHGGTALRVGKAGKGLEARYRGGTGYALDAAMHGSENQVFVASIKANLVQSVENLLIYKLQPPYNNHGKIRLAGSDVLLNHVGETPKCLLNDS